MGMWAVFTLFGLIFTMRYAARIKANPMLSLSYQSDLRQRNQQSSQVVTQYQTLDSVILLAFFAGLGWIHLGRDQS